MPKVIATKDGFHVGHRRAGEEFDIPEGMAVGSWMELVDEDDVPEGKPLKSAKGKGNKKADDSLV